jgi:hypothetical protein
MIATGKLYSTAPSCSQNIGKTARLQLKGSVRIYGSEDLPAAIANMTPVSDTLTDSYYYALDTLPTYIAFVGTATVINIGGYTLTEIGNIS